MTYQAALTFHGVMTIGLLVHDSKVLANRLYTTRHCVSTLGSRELHRAEGALWVMMISVSMLAKLSQTKRGASITRKLVSRLIYVTLLLKSIHNVALNPWSGAQGQTNPKWNGKASKVDKGKGFSSELGNIFLVG